MHAWMLTNSLSDTSSFDDRNHRILGYHAHSKMNQLFAHVLRTGRGDLQALFDSPKKTFRDYKNKRDLIGFGAKVMRKLGLEKRFFR